MRLEDFLLGIYIGGGLVAIFAVVVGVFYLIYQLGKHNIVFAFVDEGTAKAIKRFGQFKRCVIAYKGYSLNPESLDVTPDAASFPQKEKKDQRGKERKLRIWPKWLGGLRFVGIPFVDVVHAYNFRWTSFEQTAKEKKEVGGVITGRGESIFEFVHTEKIIDYIILRDDVYPLVLKEIELEGMVPVDITLLLLIRIKNPYKALFRTQNWLETTENRISSLFRSYIRKEKDGEGMTFEKLTAYAEKMEKEDVEDPFLEETGLGHSLEEEYGVKVKKVGLVSVSASGKRGEAYVAAASKKWEASREVDRLKEEWGKIVEFGEPGLFIRLMEAIEKSSEKPGNWIIPVGDLRRLVGEFAGKKKGGD